MGISINAVAISGNLTRDPELKHVGQNETAVAEISVAVNSREKRGGEWTDRVDYFDVVVWGSRAETVAKYLSKGSRVVVSGRLRQDRWEDKDSGKGRSKVRVVAREVQFADGGGSGGGGGGWGVDEEPPPKGDDDIPF